jgi:transcriptional regulator with XRE-family HTH domain
MLGILSALADKSTTRYCGRAMVIEKADTSRMSTEQIITDWRPRLLAAIAVRKTSQRAVSVAAGLGPGAVNSWFKEGKDPSVSHLLKVAKVLDLSAVYLFAGIDASPATERIFTLLEARPEAQAAILQLLEAKQS